MDLNSIGLMIVRNTYIDPSIVTEIITSETQIDTLDQFLEVIKTKIDNIRLERLNITLLLASLTYGWRGNAAKEVMASALEHVPTWIACLAVAIKEKNFKDSPIAKISKFYTRNNKDKEFLLRLEDMLIISEQEF